MKRFGLIGHPLGHSLSPQIHRGIMDVAGIDGDYRLFDIAPENLRRELPALIRELDGINCTIPHKTAVIEQLARLDDSARLAGAVNTIDTRAPAGAAGYNTDIAGFERTCGMDLRGKRVAILGSGGTARAFAAACLAQGAQSLAIAARNAEKSAALAAGIAEAFPGAATEIRVAPDASESFDADAFDIILNSTPLGMWPRCGGIPLDPALLGPGAEVFDPIYNPVATRLVLNARKRGARASSGLRMLVRQAIEAQKIWNPGAALDAAAIEAALLPPLLRELPRKSPFKLLLTGFMGAGKSTVGRILAAKLGFAFIDLDSEIERAAARPIPRIFAEDGEPRFREMERAAAAAALASGGSAVIATGGGFPTFAENRELVRAGSALVFDIAISFEEAWRRVDSATSSPNARPLARSRADTEALHKARKKVYDDFCDFQAETADSPEAVADAFADALGLA